jgi:glyoxylase-like metal-dependent hydrolase (beta-lactamase superfamily II)
MRIAAIVALAAAFVIVPGEQVAAQDARAVQVLDKALAELGGEAKIRSLRSVYFSGKGFEDSTVNAQPYLPGKPARNAHEEKLAVFLDGRRLAYELRTDRGDGTTRWRRFFFPDSRRVVADFINRSVSASNVQYPSSDRDQDARRIPHSLLLEIKDAATTLEYAGTHEDAYDVITAKLRTAEIQLSLFFDRRTNLLAKYEFTADLPGLGQSRVEYTFDDYRPHDKLGHFPTVHQIKINGGVFRSIKIDSALADSAEADEMLRLPADLEGFITPAGTVREIAKGIYFVYNVGGFQPMFIEFDTFLMAIEAPANVPVLEETPLENLGRTNVATQEFIAKMRQTVPGKPIKYVVTTHSHADHYGGLRAFIPDKPIVLTTPGNKALYERFVPELKVEVFDKKKTIAEGSMAVDLISVGANPHTEENIVAYFPRERYLFQGDLFYFNGDMTFPARDRMTVMPFFAKWLKQSGLAPARIYGFHSTLFATMEHVQKVLDLSDGDRARKGPGKTR